jgi:parvulin-like peptidyl-prolyl isomerase
MPPLHEMTSMTRYGVDTIRRMRVSRPVYFLTALLLSLILSSFSTIMNDDDTIVRINNRTIGLQEFQARLNYLPQTLRLPEKEIKETLLCTLIAETILSSEALHGALDTLERVRLLSREYADEALYEQWMDSEVRDRVKVTEKELLSAYRRFTERRSVAYWIVPDLAAATELQEKVAKGIAPAEKPQFKEIEYAESLQSVEDAVYRLKEGAVSPPVPVDGSYYVFQLLKRMPHPEYSKYDFTFWKRSVEKKVRARKETTSLESRLSALMKGKQYSVRRDVYDFLVRQLCSVIYDKESLRNESPELIQQEIGTQETGGRSFFGQPLITFNDGEAWTAGDFWKKLSVCPYPLNFKNPEGLRNGLLDVVRNIILFESIVEDGKKKRYSDSQYARNQSQMWNGNLLAQTLVADYRKSVSVDELELTRYYDSTKDNHLKPEQRKIIPIIVKSRELAEELRRQIMAGADIVSLAQQHSLGSANLDRENPGVYVVRDSWGDIGKVAFELKEGQLSEPVRNTDTTYAIVKLLGVKPVAPYQFDEIRDRLYVVLQDRRLQQKLEELLLHVVKQYDIKVDRAALRRVKYLGGNLAVRKSHFPLRNAVPGFRLFDPKAKWYQEGVGGN